MRIDGAGHLTDRITHIVRSQTRRAHTPTLADREGGHDIRARVPLLAPTRSTPVTPATPATPAFRTDLGTHAVAVVEMTAAVTAVAVPAPVMTAADEVTVRFTRDDAIRMLPTRVAVTEGLADGRTVKCRTVRWAMT